jgi:P2 family phage contractile tail tube protein
MIPSKIKDFIGFIDGRGKAGKAKELTLPKLALKMDEYRPGGFDAGVKIEMGMEALEAKVVWEEYDKARIRQFGKADLPIVFRASKEANDNSSEAIIITMRGQVQELDMGGWKAGDDTKLEETYTLTYYKYEQGGEVLIEIDIENGIRIIDGVDQLAERRRNLGL